MFDTVNEVKTIQELSDDLLKIFDDFYTDETISFGDIQGILESWIKKNCILD